MEHNNIKPSSKQRQGNPQVLEIKRKLKPEWKADELMLRKSEEVRNECIPQHLGSAMPMRGQEMWPWPMKRGNWN